MAPDWLLGLLGALLTLAAALFVAGRRLDHILASELAGREDEGS